MIAAPTQKKVPLLISLAASPASVELELVGGKAHSLMALNEVGLRVPEGFVLTTRVQEQCMGRPEQLAKVLKALPRISGAKLMVRSSAVGEDGVDSSFAGQLESYQVSNDVTEISLAIQRCWASMHTERVATYAKQSGRLLERMGVIVQHMIEPDYAGVYFTAHPMDAGCELVEYVQGHCEKLVQGEVTPVSVSLPSAHRFPFPLEDLQSGSARIKAYKGSDQDVEWLVKDGEVYFVQARPITGAGVSRRRRISWSSTNVNENYPDPLSPLLHSIARRSYYHYFKNLGRKLGVVSEGEGEQQFANIIGTWGERMYYNMTNVHGVIALAPLGNLLGTSFDNFVGYQKQLGKKRKSTNLISKLRFALAAAWHFLRLPKHVRNIEARVDSYSARGPNRDELPTLFHQFLDIRFNHWFHASFADFYAMTFHGLLGAYLKRLGLPGAEGLQNSLVQSIPGLVSNEPIFSLWRIKRAIQDNGQSGVVLGQEASDFWEQLQSDDELTELKSQIEQHLAQWGFRCTGELSFLGKNHIEDPVSFIKLLQLFLASPDVDPAARFAEKREQQQRILRETRALIRRRKPGVRSIVQGAVLSWLARSAMRSISARERVRLKQAQMYFHFKRVCQAFGEQLVERGVLDRRSSVFFLEYDEVSRLLGFGETDTDHWRKLVDLRRIKMRDAKEKCENLVNFEFDLTDQHIDQDLDCDDGSVLSGMPACGGTVSGRAVVLASIHEIDQIQRGDILVTRQTDPGWICAFPLIAGLVVARGGMLSHGAIVAREFGLPAVVGIKGITDVIQTGDLIEVDGNSGVVRCKTP